MIALVRHDVNILDPRGNPNPGELKNGVHIACATRPDGVSHDPNALTFQLVNRF
jgi:hypothetical protein